MSLALLLFISAAEPGRCESDGDCLKGKAKCIWRECHCIQKFAVGDGKTKCDTVTPQGDSK